MPEMMSRLCVARSGLLQNTLVVTGTLLTPMAICQWTMWNSQVVPSIKCNYNQVIGSHFKSDITWEWYSDWHPCIEFVSRLRTIINPHNLISDSEASKNRYECILQEFLHCWYVKVARKIFKIQTCWHKIKCSHVTQWAPSKHIQGWKFVDSAWIRSWWSLAWIAQVYKTKT